MVGNRLSAPAVWPEALVIIRRHPVPTVAPALLMGALTETPYLFPDSRSLLQGVLAFLTESFAFYLYVAYAEELSLEARRRRRFIPLPRVLRSLLVAAPAAPLVTVASLGALALPTAAASVLVISGLWLKMRCSTTPTSLRPPDGTGDGHEDEGCQGIQDPQRIERDGELYHKQEM